MVIYLGHEQDYPVNNLPSEVTRCIKRIKQLEDCRDRVDWADLQGSHGRLEILNQMEHTSSEITKLEGYVLNYLKEIV